MSPSQERAGLGLITSYYSFKTSTRGKSAKSEDPLKSLKLCRSWIHISPKVFHSLGLLSAAALCLGLWRPGLALRKRGLLSSPPHPVPSASKHGIAFIRVWGSMCEEGLPFIAPRPLSFPGPS